MRGAIVIDSKVVNIIQVKDGNFKPAKGELVVSDAAQIGDNYERGEFIRPAPPPIPLDDHKQQAIDANRIEAGRRIAALFGKPAGSQALTYAEINATTQFLHLQDKQGRGETLTQAEQDFMTWARDTNAKAHAIRDAENAAAAAINAATTEAEVDAVTPTWPA